MRKNGILLMCLAVIWLGASQAWANGFPIYIDDQTNLQVWLSGPEPTQKTPEEWRDYLGDPFQTYGAKINYENGGYWLYLYTRFGPATISYQAAGKKIHPADLFIIPAGEEVPSLAIRLWDDGQESLGKYFWAPDQEQFNKTSINIMTDSQTGWWFGGRFYVNENIKPEIPVWAVVPSSGSTEVSWYHYDTLTWKGVQLADVYEIAIKLSGIVDFDPSQGFAFVWGTGTCGNDPIVGGMGAGGVVPLPGSALLLGSGILGLALLGLRRRGRRNG